MFRVTRLQVFQCVGLVLYFQQKCWAYENLELKRFKRNENHTKEEKEEGHEDHTAVLDSMFKKYDPTASPTHATDTPTKVEVSLCILSLDSISDETMEYVIDTRLTLVWKDQRLITEECRDEKDCGDHFDMKTRIKSMWMPDLYFVNSKVVKPHDQPFPNSMIYLVASGTVYHSKRMTLVMRCPMNLNLYPMDTQKCPLLICPYSLPKDELILNWYESGVTFMNPDQEDSHNFELILPIEIANILVLYDGPDISGHFSCVNATFRLQRRNGYQLAFNYTVTFFLVIASWITFWLPLTAVPARVTLGVTTLLTLLTSANHVRSSLPPITYVTAIDVWVGACCMFVFAALLQLPLAFLISNLKPIDKEEDSSNKFKRSRSSRISYVGSRHNRFFEKAVSEPKPKTNHIQFDKWCRCIFPGLYLIFNIAYWSHYLPKSSKK